MVCDPVCATTFSLLFHDVAPATATPNQQEFNGDDSMTVHVGRCGKLVAEVSLGPASMAENIMAQIGWLETDKW